MTTCCFVDEAGSDDDFRFVVVVFVFVFSLQMCMSARSPRKFSSHVIGHITHSSVKGKNVESNIDSLCLARDIRLRVQPAASAVEFGQLRAYVPSSIKY